MSAATVLIPTHHAPESLPAAVESALAQTVTDIEVLIVGDGVGDEHRAVVDRCVARDARVRFLDLPKGENRGERNRHHGVLDAASEVIAYLADDDLLLPRHVEHMIELLADSDLCQSRNGYIDRDDVLRLLPTDLSDPAWHAWHLLDPPRNRVSISGTAHTRAAYLRLPRGWDLAAPGVPTDLTLWRQFFGLDGLRGRTHLEMTVLQFPGVERAHLDAAAIAAQRERWGRFLAAPDAHDELQRLAEEAQRREHLEWSALVFDLVVIRDRLQADAALQQAECERRVADIQNELDATRSTVSWRVTAPLRAVRRWTRRGTSTQGADRRTHVRRDRE